MPSVTRDVDAKITVVTDSNGRATELIQHQGIFSVVTQFPITALIVQFSAFRRRRP